MNDKDLYAQILGISSPWSLESVKLSLESKSVIVALDFDHTFIFTCLVPKKKFSKREFMSSGIEKHIEKIYRGFLKKLYQMSFQRELCKGQLEKYNTISEGSYGKRVYK